MLLIMSTPNPRSTGGHTYPLSAQQMEQRSASPAEYPCFMETGFYQPTSGCRMRCWLLHHISCDAVKTRPSVGGKGGC